MPIINPPPTNDLTSNNTTAHGPRSTVPVLVWTSAKSAVLHSCGHGWKKIDVDTSTWTTEERAYLSEHVVESQGARYGRHSVPGVKISEIEGYDVAPPTAEALRAHVKAAVEVMKAYDEKTLAAVKVEIEKLRVLPIQELVRRSSSSGVQLTGHREALNRLFSRETYGWVTPADLGRHEEFEAFERERKLREGREDGDQMRNILESLKTMPIAELDKHVKMYNGKVSVRGSYHDPANVLERAGLHNWDLSVEYIGRAEELAAYHEVQRRAKAELAAELEALLERLDPSVLPRFRDGMLPNAELHHLLRSLLAPAVEHLEEIPRTDKARWILDSEAPSSLTAAEYDGLGRTKKAAEELSLPGGAKAVVTVVGAREWIWDPSHEEADKDGEVQGDLRTVVLVKAEILGIEVAVKRLLPC